MARLRTFVHLCIVLFASVGVVGCGPPIEVAERIPADASAEDGALLLQLEGSEDPWKESWDVPNKSQYTLYLKCSDSSFLRLRFASDEEVTMHQDTILGANNLGALVWQGPASPIEGGWSMRVPLDRLSLPCKTWSWRGGSWKLADGTQIPRGYKKGVLLLE